MIAFQYKNGGHLRQFRLASQRVVRIDPIAYLDVFNIYRDILNENAVFRIFRSDNDLRPFREAGKITAHHTLDARTEAKNAGD